MKTAIRGKWQSIITKGEFAWRLTDQYPLQFGLMGLDASPSVSSSINGNCRINDGLWHHIVAAYDGDGMFLYVDDKLVASDWVRGPIAMNTCPVLIGGNDENPGCKWNGLLDDVRIYNYALSESEIRSLYAGKEER